MKKQNQEKKLQQQIEELGGKWKRAVADYQNLERRVNDQQQAFVKFANAMLIEKLLGVIDDLERAVKHLRDEGLGLVMERFLEILKSEGVERIEAVGKNFDANLMECAEMVEGEKDKVAKVALAGYTLNGKVLRPAKVMVGKGKTHE